MKSYNVFCEHCLNSEDEKMMEEIRKEDDKEIALDALERAKGERIVCLEPVVGAEGFPVMPKNKGGRPVKPDADKKSKVVQVRFTQDDFEAIEQLSIKAGFKNVSHFIRSIVNNCILDEL